MKKWLTTALLQMSLTEDNEDYLLSRGCKESTYQEMGLVTWSQPETNCTADYFSSRYGEKGQALQGCLITPYYSPSGNVVGFEARRQDPKWISDFRVLPDSKWVPVGIGMRKSVPKVWGGHDVWIVEGQFDLYALEWVVPEKDAILATVRAGLSYQHTQFLKRFCTGTVHIAYDEDETGREATKKAISWLQSVGVYCREVRFSGAKDPGEVWDRGGEEAVQRVFGPLL